MEVLEKKTLLLKRKLMHYLIRAMKDFNMIQAGDRVLVCLSGGKDSYTLTVLLHELSKKVRNFEVHAFTLDQGQPGWEDQKLRAYLDARGINYTIITRDTYSIVKSKIPEGQTYCALCSRLRRGNIYGFAQQHGFNKIALGHHRDDVITTYLMSILYGGQTKAMPPKLLTDSKEHIVIRPLVYAQEKDIAAFAELMEFPIIPCNLCGSQEKLMRKKVKALIASLAAENPKVPSNILHAVSSIGPSQLMDRRLWNFKDLERNMVACDEDAPITEDEGEALW